MRKTLMSLTAVAALSGAVLVSAANAAPARIEGATVQTVQYYGGWHRGWHHVYWHRPYYGHRWHHWHRWHHRW